MREKIVCGRCGAVVKENGTLKKSFFQDPENPRNIHCLVCGLPEGKVCKEHEERVLASCSEPSGPRIISY